MNHEVCATRHVAVGFFTAEQLEEKHRAMLHRAANAPTVPSIRTAVESVHITVYGPDTGRESFDMSFTNLAMKVLQPGIDAKGAKFVIHRFDPRVFPPAGTRDTQKAFEDYLASDAGVGDFGTATAVQLFELSVAVTADAG
jgi:hypothetical protein